MLAVGVGRRWVFDGSAVWFQRGGLGWGFSTGTLKLLGKSTERSRRLKSLQLPPQKLTAERLVVN